MLVKNIVRKYTPISVINFKRKFLIEIEKHHKILNFIDHKILGNKRIMPVHIGIKSLTTKNERIFIYESSCEAYSEKCVDVHVGAYLGGALPFHKSHVIGIDLFEECPDEISDGCGYIKAHVEKVEKNLKKCGYDNFTLIKGDAGQLGKNWDREKINMIFIDGDHLTPTEDFLAFLPHMRINNEAVTYVLWHDSSNKIGEPRMLGYARPDTSKKVHEFLNNHKYLFGYNDDNITYYDSITRIKLVSNEIIFL